MNIILRIIKIAFKNKFHITAAYLSMIASAAAYLLLPEVFGNTIDSIAESLDGGVSLSTTKILTLSGIIIGLSTIRGIFGFGQQYFSESVSQLAVYEIRNQFFDRIQKLSLSFHDKSHTGNLMSRAITDVENIRMFISIGLIRGPYFFIMFVTVAIILINMDTKLGLLSIAFMPVVAIQSIFARLKMRILWTSVQERMGELSTTLQETLTGMRVVKAFGAEEHELKQLDAGSKKVATEMIKVEYVRATNMSFMIFVFMLSLAIILIFGGRSVIGETLSLGDLTKFLFYMQLLSIPIRMLGFIVASTARATSAGGRIYEIIDTESEVKETSKPLNFEKISGEVQFENVSFSYDTSGNSQALKGLDFTVTKGDVIALIGTPGSGKSTLVSLLTRFYDPIDGKIKIDGYDIKNFKISDLRHNIGIVQQDIFIFTDSIKENIAYGDPSASMESIVNAAKLAQLHDFIETLPDGYETMLSERGVNLSGGQRQRLAIARAIVLDPPILILDDSTASVDTNTERLILNAMKNVMKGRTTFVIAHRLSTIRNADQIFVMDKGAIVAKGKHDSLIQEGGLYEEIYNLQLKPQNDVMLDISKDDLSDTKVRI